MSNILKWYTKDLDETNDYIRILDSQEEGIIAQAITANSNDSSTIFENLTVLYEQIMDALLYKKGFMMVKGLPTLGPEDNSSILKNFFVSFCASLGTPLIQNKNDDILFDVKSVEGLSLANRDSRGPYVKDSLPMHTDAGAILGMYCLASADVGGHTLLANARTVHDEIKDLRPDLLDVLYQPFYCDRRGNECPGTLPYDYSPVFAMHGDHLKCQYHQPFYDDALKKFPELPRYTEQQIEALQLFDRVSLEKHIAFETKLEPGCVIFINNEEILHGRTSFDYVSNQSIRYLLRIWLNTPRIQYTFPSFLGYPA